MNTMAWRAFWPVLICALLWGSSFPSIKTVYLHWDGLGIERTIPLILLFAGVRFTAAGLGLLLVSRRLGADLKATPWKLLVGLALLQTVVQYVFFYNAVSISSASLAALLTATGSFWWMLWAAVFRQTPWPRALQWLVLTFGAVGVTLAVYRPGAGAGQPVLGAILLMAATCSGALAVLIYRKIQPTMSARGATGISLFLGGLVLAAMGVEAAPQLGKMFDGKVIIITVWLSIVSAVGFALWNHTSTRFPVPLLASYRFLVPVCGVLEALIFLPKESAGWGLVVGGAMVIGSMWLAQRLARQPTEERVSTTHARS